MTCPECFGKKGKMVGIVICDAFGQHFLPGTESLEDCLVCDGTGVVPDEIVLDPDECAPLQGYDSSANF